MRRAIVVTLEWACGWLDKLPNMCRYEGSWHISAGCWGCHPLRLSLLSARLDERWQTNVWQ
jgi:hypothetical protein